MTLLNVPPFTHETLSNGQTANKHTLILVICLPVDKQVKVNLRQNLMLQVPINPSVKRHNDGQVSCLHCKCHKRDSNPYSDELATKTLHKITRQQHVTILLKLVEGF